jgi:hypothetical protein
MASTQQRDEKAFSYAPALDTFFREKGGAIVGFKSIHFVKFSVVWTNVLAISQGIRGLQFT